MTIHFTNFLESDPEFENIVYFDRVYGLKEVCVLILNFVYYSVGKNETCVVNIMFIGLYIIKLPNVGEEGRFLSLL